MPVKHINFEEGRQTIRDRLKTRDWWLFPVINQELTETVVEIKRRFYSGDNAVLYDTFFVLAPTPEVPWLGMTLCSKSCMSAAQLSEVIGQKIPDDTSQDVILTGDTPVSVMLWIYMNLVHGR